MPLDIWSTQSFGTPGLDQWWRRRVSVTRGRVDMDAIFFPVGNVLNMLEKIQVSSS